MATISFDKKFVVSNLDSFNKMLDDLEKPKKIKVVERNYKLENIKGIKLLKQRLHRISGLECEYNAKSHCY